MANVANAEATVREYVARINAHDAKGIVALCTRDHVLTDSLGSRLSGLDRLERGWLGYFSLFPDYRVELHAIASTGDVVVACGSAAATHAPSGAAWRSSFRSMKKSDLQIIRQCRIINL